MTETPSAPDTPPPAISVDEDGTVRFGAQEAPLSPFLSAEGRALLAARLRAPPMSLTQGLEGMRAGADAAQEALVGKWLALHPSQIARIEMNGVPVDVVTPASGVSQANERRVLINLHGGGYFIGSAFGGQLEAIPLAARGAIKVVAVDYRLAPEHHFPAASEDVETVYRALLQSHEPGAIGLYGGSAGGSLVAQALAWLQSRGLPCPGAVGLFCSGALPSFWYGGDSMATTPILNGRPPLPAGYAPASPGDAYFAGLDTHDPLITPGLFPEVLARFPPTLMVTGTRDISMSNTLATHSRLIDAGVRTQLLVQEGVGHCDFNNWVGSPEATQAFDVIWRFFDEHLGA